MDQISCDGNRSVHVDFWRNRLEMSLFVEIHVITVSHPLFLNINQKPQHQLVDLNSDSGTQEVILHLICLSCECIHAHHLITTVTCVHVSTAQKLFKLLRSSPPACSSSVKLIPVSTFQSLIITCTLIIPTMLIISLFFMSYVRHQRTQTYVESIKVLHKHHTFLPRGSCWCSMTSTVQPAHSPSVWCVSEQEVGQNWSATLIIFSLCLELFNIFCCLFLFIQLAHVKQYK